MTSPTDALDGEIAWLRSFGWSDERISYRLKISVEAIQKRDIRHRQRAA